MKTLRLLPFSFSLLFSMSLIAQIDGSPRQFESTSQIFQELRKVINSKEKTPYEIDWENVKGSPYLYEKYKLGQFFVGDKSYGNVMMRLNTYTDEIELMPVEGEEVGALMKIDDSRLTFENKTLKLLPYKDEDDYAQKGYFLELTQNKDLKLLLRKKCLFSPNEKALTANQKDRAAKFTQYDYFYILKDGNLTSIEPKKKSVLKMFPDKRSEIKSYIKSEKLKLKKEKDFAKLVDYIASL
ncbi:hypothetical protein [Kordia sp.]|uniref:hypothetical protein n=1 Tax=Kordia sp. TaxID=1965332 RepID=UPI0025BEFB04|nr:hypothetical protein [Kordia sp.]MCH2196283.1 hypothetical protein [Kordia sp.]